MRLFAAQAMCSWTAVVAVAGSPDSMAATMASWRSTSMLPTARSWPAYMIDIRIEPFEPFPGVQQGFVAREAAQGTVEGEVGLDPLLEVLLVDGSAHLGEQPTQLGLTVSARSCVGQTGEASASREARERRRCRGISSGAEASDEEPAAGLGHEQALLLELPHGFAEGAAADAELVG